MKQAEIDGGGVIGLSAALALHYRGKNVLVLDARKPGTAASAANASYVVTYSTGPVPTPALVRQSIKWMLNPKSPLYIKPRLNPGFAVWLYRFWRACNTCAFDAGVHAIGELNRNTEHLIDKWQEAGVAFERHNYGRLVAYNNQHYMESRLIAHQAGGGPNLKPMYRGDLWEFEPALSQEIVAGYRV